MAAYVYFVWEEHFVYGLDKRFDNYFRNYPSVTFFSLQYVDNELLREYWDGSDLPGVQEPMDTFCPAMKTFANFITEITNLFPTKT